MREAGASGSRRSGTGGQAATSLSRNEHTSALQDGLSGHVEAVKATQGHTVLTIAAVAVAVASCTACTRKGGPSDTAENVSSVARQAERRLGQEVTIVGRVQEVISATSFTITDGVGHILVLGVATMPALDEDLDGVLIHEQVRVTGELHIFRMDEIESQVGELIDARYERFAGQPVVVANVVTPRRPAVRP